MTDYIKREDAIEELKQYFVEHDDEQDEFTRPAATLAANAIVDNMPKADVVEVVRCKDCKHRYYDKERKLYYCEMYFGLGILKDNNYCSYGER